MGSILGRYKIEQQFFSRGQDGGEFAMISNRLNTKGKENLIVIKDSMNSSDYCELLEELLLPFSEKFYREDWCSQQFNAAIHVSRYLKEFLVDCGIDLLE